MRVVHFHRKPATFAFSIESEFEAIRAELRTRPDLTVDVVECPLSNRGIPRWVINAAAAARQQGDVNHITGDVHYLAWGLAPERTVLTVHDCQFEERATGWRKRAVGWTTLSRPVHRAAAVVTPSTFTRDRVLALTGAPAAKLEVVPLCISPAFTAAPRAFNADRPTVLQVGTLPNKNIERLAAALSGLRCRLHVVGRLSASQAHSLRVSGIDLRTSVDLSEAELVAAYVQADVVAFASTYEGFGMPILEANTVGRPVVTSTVASMPETAADAAALVDPFDVASIRAAFERVFTDEAYRSELVDAGFRNATRFSPAVTADLFAAIYERVGGSGTTKT